jgi:hypothetical protein
MPSFLHQQPQQQIQPSDHHSHQQSDQPMQAENLPGVLLVGQSNAPPAPSQHSLVVDPLVGMAHHHHHSVLSNPFVQHQQQTSGTTSAVAANNNEQQQAIAVAQVAAAAQVAVAAQACAVQQAVSFSLFF